MQVFKDKTILVTGANRGIGKSLVSALLNHGATKIYATCRNLKSMPLLADDRIVPLQLDITDDEQIAQIANVALDTEILINNAGTLNPGNMLQGELLGMEHDCFCIAPNS